MTFAKIGTPIKFKPMKYLPKHFLVFLSFLFYCKLFGGGVIAD